MRITSIELSNWRNFKTAKAAIKSNVTYIVGSNASGKSNFLDSLRFLRDIAKPIGGGLQTALDERGGFAKIRSLHAHGNRKGGGTNLEIRLTLADGQSEWVYELGVNFPKDGSRNHPIVVKEIVIKDGRSIIKRPTESEQDDQAQLAVTFLEQAAQNSNFREIPEFLQKITYVHLVPQLMKYGERISGRILPDDPFGQAFMNRIADTPDRTRKSRLDKIARELGKIVPGLSALAFERDSLGRPHIEMKFQHFRAHPAKQLEDQLSDGTLRLISILWLLQERRDAPLLLEEPELSLNEEIVRGLHAMFAKLARNAPNRQIFVTTHSYALLSNPGIPVESIFIVKPSEKGSSLAYPDQAQIIAIQNGIPPGDVVLPKSPQFEMDF